MKKEPMCYACSEMATMFYACSEMATDRLPTSK
jgi:hypothetical protein